MANSIFASALERFKNQYVPVKDGHLSVTFSGEICEKRGDNYVAFINGELSEVLPQMVLDVPVYLISKPIAQVKVGDIVKTTSVNAKGNTTYTYQIITKVDSKSIHGKTFGGTNRVVTPAKGLVDGQQIVQVAINLFAGFGNQQVANGFNPMMFALLSDKTGSSDLKDLLPFMMMSQNNGQGFNPMMLLALSGDSNSDLSDILLFSAFSQQGGMNFADLFKGIATPVTTTNAPATEA